MGAYAPESATTPIILGAADCVAFVSVKFTMPNGDRLKPRHGMFIAFRGVGTGPANLTRVEGGHKVTCNRCACNRCAHQAIYRDVRTAVRDYRDHKCPSAQLRPTSHATTDATPPTSSPPSVPPSP